MDKKVQRAIDYAERKSSAAHEARAPERQTKAYQDGRKREIERRANIVHGSKNDGRYR